MNVKTKAKKQFKYITCSELVGFFYWTGKSMNNRLTYCGLVDARISASEKDLLASACKNQSIFHRPGLALKYKTNRNRLLIDGTWLLNLTIL